MNKLRAFVQATAEGKGDLLETETDIGTKALGDGFLSICVSRKKQKSCRVVDMVLEEGKRRSTSWVTKRARLYNILTMILPHYCSRALPLLRKLPYGALHGWGPLDIDNICRDPTSDMT